jgi:L-erythrulose 1-phosphate isomerase
MSLPMKKNIPWIGTSWKMNKLAADAADYAQSLAQAPSGTFADARIFIIPPFPYIRDVAQILTRTPVAVGGQNMHWSDEGAWTGEVSGPMLKDCGASLVEIGHSERRTHFNETDETVALKTAAAIRHGLLALVCIGDTKEEFAAGNTAQALERQTRALFKHVPASASENIVIAYEPVWSIGEGGTPAEPGFANCQHQHIKRVAQDICGQDVPVLYGGSVNLANCRSLITEPEIDGLFIGRAAWQVHGFLDIIAAVKAATRQSRPERTTETMGLNT